MAISLITWAAQTVTPKHDAIIQDACAGRSGILYGCNVSAGSNTLMISAGYGVIKGRLFEVTDTTVGVTLPPSGTQNGTLIIRLDISNTSTPIEIAVETGTYTPEQDEDANFDSGVYELVLATFDITSSGISNLTQAETKVPYNRTPVYQSLADLELSGDSTYTLWQIVQAMANNSTALIDGSAISNLPYANAEGVLIIIKVDGSHYRAYFLSGGNNPDYQYYLNAWEAMPHSKDMYYLTNSTTTYRFALGGYLTNGGTSIVASVPTSKKLRSGRRLNILMAYGGVTVRQNGKYLIGSGSRLCPFNEDITTTFQIYENEIIFTFTNSNGFSGINNAPVAVTGFVELYED